MKRVLLICGSLLMMGAALNGGALGGDGALAKGGLSSPSFTAPTTAFEPPAGFTCRWNASDLGLSDTASIASWAADSASSDGANCTVAQGTGTAQPTYVASNSAFGNQPTASFDAGDSLGPSSALTTNSVFTICVVGVVDNTSGNYGLTSAAAGTYFRTRTTNALQFRINNSGLGVTSTVSGATPFNACGLLRADGNVDLWLNGTLEADISAEVGTWGVAYLGSVVGASGMLGDLAEVVVYNSDLVASGDIATWETYVCETYGVGSC